MEKSTPPPGLGLTQGLHQGLHQDLHQYLYQQLYQVCIENIYFGEVESLGFVRYSIRVAFNCDIQTRGMFSR